MNGEGEGGKTGGRRKHKENIGKPKDKKQDQGSTHKGKTSRRKHRNDVDNLGKVAQREQKISITTGGTKRNGGRQQLDWTLVYTTLWDGSSFHSAVYLPTQLINLPRLL